MNRIRVSLALLLLTTAATPNAKGDLAQEIQDWKPGNEVPHRLLSFPGGKVDPPNPNICGLAAYAESVRPYIAEIENDSLLEEIVFDRRSEETSLNAAVTRLIERRGLIWFSNTLAKRESTRWELDAFRQMLQSPFARTSVAFISKGAMPNDEAKHALEDLKSRLDKGDSWAVAYDAVAEAHPDAERRKKEPGSPATLITYLYSGWISAFGFSFSTLQITPYVPAPYFAEAIHSGRGGKFVSAPEGEYLLYVFEVYVPSA